MDESLEELYDYLRNATDFEFVELLNEIGDSNGFESGEQMLDSLIKSLKQTCEIFEEALKECGETLTIQEVAAFILSCSVEFGNGKWIRKSKLMNKYEIDEMGFSMGVMAFESRKFWFTIFDALMDKVDLIQCDIEEYNNKICLDTRRFILGYEELEETYSVRNTSMLTEEAKYILEKILRFYEILLYNLKMIRIEVKVHY